MAAPSSDLLCFICNGSVSGDVSVVKERGIKTLIEASIKRKQVNHKHYLKDLKQVSVHSACQTNYINTKLIKAYLCRSAKSGPQSTQTRSTGDAFTFKDHCFFCNEKITREFIEIQKKLPISRRKVVHLVQVDTLRESVLTAAQKRGDEWGETVINRLSSVTDLVAADAMYHAVCHKRFYGTNAPTGEKRGYRPATTVDEAMEHIYVYLADHSDECQFSLEELMDQIEGDFRPEMRTVKDRLFKKYGSDIIIAETSNRITVVCFKNTGFKILSDNWYENRKTDPKEERLRVVQAAAAIILEDIRSQIYSTTQYPPSDQFLSDIEDVIPQSLLSFFKTVVITNKRGSCEKWKQKCIALSHAVISAVRPRSFFSSLLTGVSVYLYKKFGSRQLIDILSALGFSASHHEAVLLEMSTVLQPNAQLINTSTTEDVFLQFIFDNADFNVNTLDGLHTFHAMGGIMPITPATVAATEEPVKRLKKINSFDLVQQAGAIKLQTFQKNEDNTLTSVDIRDLETLCPIGNDIKPSTADIIWLYGKSIGMSLPGWNGFMEQATSKRDSERSKIVYLPFINAPPSRHDTVYTSLLEASQRCKTLGQKTCFVTFDQPLYLKAKEIVHSDKTPELDNVIVRLGGFHLLMSFMGAIGVIMAGSGLKDLIACIFAENSIPKIMSGHSYSRAIRAHFLAHQALGTLVVESIDFSVEDRAVLENLLTNLDRSVVLTAGESEEFQRIEMKFHQALDHLQSNGPTAQLWIQYFKMVTLVKKFIEAERMGNWSLHIQTVKQMIPFFHAAGHLFYAKCAHLYLQDMCNLQKTLDPKEYVLFTTKGYFTIRRSEKFWSGIWSDMTIEQTMMKNMKSIGGLTHGRGMSESVLMRWTLGMVALQNICEEVEKFTYTSSSTSEQHIDMRRTRMERDDRDVGKMQNWLSTHPPFPVLNAVMSISSGVVGSEKVNCHMSQDCGISAVSSIVGGTFGALKLKRSNKVVTLASEVNVLKVGNNKVTIDPLTLFQRICIAKQTPEDLEYFFTYELAPYPFSLFSEDGMRKGTKSSLYSAFSSLPNTTKLPLNRTVVVDGGFLLHKVIWNRTDSFHEVCKRYVKFVRDHYGANVVVIFDGYPLDPEVRGTKSAERFRRCNINTSSDVIFNESTIAQVQQEKFLANENNKLRFISLLEKTLIEDNVTVKQAVEDADVLIVTTAISLAAEYDAVEIIGEDIDLLVLMTSLAQGLSIYFRKPGRGGAPDKLFTTSSYKYSAPENLLLLHALSGCDTTSSLFGFGKTKFCTLFQNRPALNEIATIFKDHNASVSTIAEAGERILVALYGGDRTTTLDALRYRLFSKSATGSKLNLSKLPPTQDAAMYHVFRTYHQVQTWMGQLKNPLDWGWRKGSKGLDPIKTTRDPAPQSILTYISCQCKKGCTKACSCIKSGLKCSIICKNCCGQTCDNTPDIIIDENDEDDPIELLNEEVEEELAECSRPNKTKHRKF